MRGMLKRAQDGSPSCGERELEEYIHELRGQAEALMQTTTLLEMFQVEVSGKLSPQAEQGLRLLVERGRR